MVAAKDYHQDQSSVLKYSCDEGYSWNEFQFIDVSVHYSFGMSVHWC